CMQSQAFPYTF
nr:immunoglobulin light chain junction region [Macaca mulatta]MOV75798.1 immunoglobulin light chain junction region [Macaca mulatta]